MRLDKFVAGAAGLTRGEARTRIRAGAVTVDGRAESDAGRSLVGGEAVCLDGRPLSAPGYVYIMMNKPAGCVCATEDKREKTVIDLLPPELRRLRLFPVGRLDKDAEGLLLITNDGALAHKALSPKKRAGKKYFLRLSLPLPDDKIDILEKGVDIGGYVTKPCGVEKIDDFSAYITVTEGKFHQVKRMLAAVGSRVEYLRRVAFAGLELDESLKTGQYRELCTKEIEKILLTIQ